MHYFRTKMFLACYWAPWSTFKMSLVIIGEKKCFLNRPSIHSTMCTMYIAQCVHSIAMFQIPGNKMTSSNLAIVIGPNIMHRRKTGNSESKSQVVSEAWESPKVIEVVRELIEHNDSLFIVRVKCSYTPTLLHSPLSPSPDLPLSLFVIFSVIIYISIYFYNLIIF